MLPKAHLTSHSRMSGSRWVITPSWLSRSLRYFLYSSFVYSCHLFLVSSASIKSLPFLSFIVPIFAGNVPLVSLIFLKRSLVPPYTHMHTHTAFLLYCFPLFLCIVHSGRLSYLSFLFFGTLQSRWVYLSFSPLPFTSLLFSAICKASSDNHFAFFISVSLGWFWSLPPVQCYQSPSIVLQALYQIQFLGTIKNIIKDILLYLHFVILSNI